MAYEETKQAIELNPIKWQKGGLIGSGAFGKVYLGLNLVTGELLAVKQVVLVGEKEQQRREVIKNNYFRKMSECFRIVGII